MRNDMLTNGGENGEERVNISALKKFRDLDLKASSEVDDTSLPSLHQNTITTLSVIPPPAGTINGQNCSTTFATSGQDGMLIMWQLPLF